MGHQVNGIVGAKKPNVVILGGSYVGCKCLEFVAAAMHKTHNIVLVEKNSHFQHLFAFPRFAVVPGYEHLAFLPYTSSAFLNPAAALPPGPKPSFLAESTGPTPADSVSILQATVTQVLPNSLVLRPGDASSTSSDTSLRVLDYDYLVIATGTKLPPPGTLHTEGKLAGVEYFKQYQEQIKAAKKIVVIGGGAVGVQMATDIKEVFPEKNVTIIHSREHLMNKFHPRLHEIIMDRNKELGIEAILQDRVKVPPGGFPVTGQDFDIQLQSGKSVKADFAIICTGQIPLSDFMSSLSPESLSSSGHILVKSTLQIADDRYPNVFAIGDVAETGAPKAARPGFKQAMVVTENMRKLYDERMKAGGEANGVQWQTYKGDPAGIHLTLGLTRNVLFSNPAFETPDAPPKFTLKDDGAEDMGIKRVWLSRAPGRTDYHA